VTPKLGLHFLFTCRDFETPFFPRKYD